MNIPLLAVNRQQHFLTPVPIELNNVCNNIPTTNNANFAQSRVLLTASFWLLIAKTLKNNR